MTFPGTIPATLLTGFLGSGKTTLLNRLLKDPGMADTAVVINEFGDVAIDHLLVERSIENAVVLQSGCVCCTVRGDLVDTLTDLVAKAERGDIPRFARVAIETTGLADPSAIVATFAGEPLVSDLFHLRAVVTTVDAVNGARQLDEFAEASRQAALADLIVLTMTDIAEPGSVTELTARLVRLNPGADVVQVVNGALSAADLFAHVPDQTAAAEWLRADAFAPHDHDHDHHHDHVPVGESRSAAHDAAIAAFSLTTDRTIGAEGLALWLASITTLRGDDMLRMKGIVAVEGDDVPTAIHAVQHVVHPPARLPRWPTDERLTRIVFITRGLPAEGLLASFHAFAAEPVA